jgi:hypothetical protein
MGQRPGRTAGGNWWPGLPASPGELPFVKVFVPPKARTLPTAEFSEAMAWLKPSRRRLAPLDRDARRAEDIWACQTQAVETGHMDVGIHRLHGMDEDADVNCLAEA